MSSPDKAAAEKLAEQLRQDGLDAYIVELQETSVLYRVRVGAFKSREEAKKLQGTLRIKGFESWIAPFTGKSTSPQQSLAPAGQKTNAEAPDMPQPVAPAAATSEDKPSQQDADRPAAQVPEEKPAAETAPEVEPPQFKVAPDEAQQHPDTAPQGATGSKKDKADAGAAKNAEPVAETKLFELIINPIPAFTEEQPAKELPTAALACKPVTTYRYFNAQDATLHITTSPEKIPAAYKNQVLQIEVFPVHFKSLNLRDMTIQVKVEAKHFDLILESLTQAGQTPSPQAIRDFEGALGAGPLRMLYYPARTDPDGTLHGGLFLQTGASVEMELVRRGLAACDDTQPWLQHTPCSDIRQNAKSN